MVAKTSAAAAGPAPYVLPYPMPAAMFTADLDGVLRGVTPPLAQMLGREADALCGMSLDAMVSAGDAARLSGLREALALGHDSGVQTDVTLVTAAGERLPAALYLSQLVQAGQPTLLQGMLIDHSYRYQKENADSMTRERMRRISNLIALGEMASSIAHEVNQPLTAITALGQTCVMLLKKGGDPGHERMLKLVENMSEQAFRASQVVKRIRAFVTTHGLVREDVAVNALIESARQTAVSELRAAGVRLIVDAPSDLPKINGDLIYLQQVILNLGRNAVQAMAHLPSAERELRITARQAGETVAIMFDDRGPGVPEDLRPRLFEPFFTTKSDGTGLGLATCLRILQAHGGSLDYDSNPHGGARFIMTLPIAREEASAAGNDAT